MFYCCIIFAIHKLTFYLFPKPFSNNCKISQNIRSFYTQIHKYLSTSKIVDNVDNSVDNCIHHIFFYIFCGNPRVKLLYNFSYFFLLPILPFFLYIMHKYFSFYFYSFFSIFVLHTIKTESMERCFYIETSLTSINPVLFFNDKHFLHKLEYDNTYWKF